jgi:hypothetical protein
LFAPIHERTNRVDGWVSLEVSPLLAYDSQKSSGPPATNSPNVVSYFWFPQSPE